MMAHLRELAEARGVMPGQISLAWLLAQQPWIVPIPGTRQIERVEEKAAATAIALSAYEVADLNSLTQTIPVAGNLYNDAGMAMVGL